MSGWLYGPDSMTWRINRESILLVGGPSALLMQLAHPSVAAGVGQHSDFQSDSLARLRRTLDTMLTLIFGDEPEARAALERVNRIHSHVKGTREDGTPYSAHDPHLLLWVFSTLLDSSIRVYEACVAPLTPEEVAIYYEEAHVMAGLFGIADMLPPTYGDLRAWMKEMIDSGEVVVTPLARELASDILRPVRFLPRRLAEAGAFLTASFLPDEIREGYGLKIGPSRRALLKVGRRATRRLVPLMPRPLRLLPGARTAR